MVPGLPFLRLNELPLFIFADVGDDGLGTGIFVVIIKEGGTHRTVTGFGGDFQFLLAGIAGFIPDDYLLKLFLVTGIQKIIDVCPYKLIGATQEFHPGIGLTDNIEFVNFQDTDMGIFKHIAQMELGFLFLADQLGIIQGNGDLIGETDDEVLITFGEDAVMGVAVGQQDAGNRPPGSQRRDDDGFGLQQLEHGIIPVQVALFNIVDHHRLPGIVDPGDELSNRKMAAIIF
jgi:hypothetical protein